MSMSAVRRPLKAQTLDVTRFVPSDRPVVLDLIRAYSARKIVSPVTAENYVYSLYNIASNCAPSVGIVSSLSQSPERLFACMERKFTTVSTLLNSLNGIVAIYNHARPGRVKGGHRIQAFWRAKQLDASVAVSAQSKNNVMTEKKRNNTMNLSELDDAIRRVRTGEARRGHASEATWIMQLLWLVIARNVPPKRLDYGHMRVVGALREVKPAENAIVVPKGKGSVQIVLGNFKTERTYKTYTETVNDTVSAEVRSSLRDLPREYLFVQQDMSPMSGPYFGSWMQSTFKTHLGKHATSNALRRAWVREMADPNKYTIAEREELAHKMNHSLLTQFMHYGLVDR